MIHSTFGSNRPIILTFLLVPAIALVVAAIYANTFGNNSLGGPGFHFIINGLQEFPVWRKVLGMLLIVGNATLLNFVFNKHDFATSENYFPALIFLGFVCLDFRSIDLHPILLSTLFGLLALRRILTVYRAESALSIGFDTALFLSLAIFFFPPAIFMLPLPWLAFVQLRPFNLKEWIVPLTAIAAVALYIFGFYFIGGHSFSPDEYFLLGSRIPVMSEEGRRLGIILIVSLFTILTGLGLIAFFNDIAKSTLRKKGTKYIFLWTFFLLIIQYLYITLLGETQSGSWLIFAVPVSVFLGVYFSGKGKRPMVRVIFFYAWLISCVSFMLFSN